MIAESNRRALASMTHFLGLFSNGVAIYDSSNATHARRAEGGEKITSNL
jgi:hypothetical protein